MLHYEAMRYLIQLLIPALIFVVVVYLGIHARRVRSRKSESTAEDDNNVDSGAFILILVIGAMVAVGVVFALQSFWVPAI